MEIEIRDGQILARAWHLSRCIGCHTETEEGSLLGLGSLKRCNPVGLTISSPDGLAWHYGHDIMDKEGIVDSSPSKRRMTYCSP